MDIETLRADTPACRERVHLNNAGAALPPSAVIEAVRAHFELECTLGGYEAADARADAISDAYRAIGALVGAPPRNIALADSATAAYTQALTSIPFERGDLIFTTR